MSKYEFFAVMYQNKSFYPELVLVTGNGDSEDEIAFIDRDYRVSGVMPGAQNIIRAFGPSLEAPDDEDIRQVIYFAGSAYTFKVFDQFEQMKLFELFNRRLLLDTPNHQLTAVGRLTKSLLT